MPTEIKSIEDLQSLVIAGETHWQQYGEVRTEQDDDLILFDYKSAAQWAGRWNFFERISRGLILNRNTGEIVARPFDKFFNWGEHGLTPTLPVIEITDKLDGSLGILYRHHGEYRIATRGAFHSDQAQWATQFLRSRYDLSDLPEELTLLFEMIYPGNRIIVNYQDREDLVLIGVRNRFTGEDWFYAEFAGIAKRYGFALPEAYEFDDIASMLDIARTLDLNREGWIVRFEDGTRLKIKGDAYRLAHRIVTQATFNQVLTAVSEGNLMMIIEGVPDEFLGQIRAWQQEIEMVVSQTHERVGVLFAQVPKADRKAAALWIRDNCQPDSSYLFAMLDGRDITPLIYRTAFKRQQEVEE